MKAELQKNQFIARFIDKAVNHPCRIGFQIQPKRGSVGKAANNLIRNLHQPPTSAQSLKSAGNTWASMLRSRRGGGQPLPESFRDFIESRFGRSFRQVCVHNDEQANELAQSIRAKAFTSGRDIFFATGHYSPGTIAGRRLLTHELTHVVQQSGSGAKQSFFPKLTRSRTFGRFVGQRFGSMHSLFRENSVGVLPKIQIIGGNRDGVVQRKITLGYRVEYDHTKKDKKTGAPKRVVDADKETKEKITSSKFEKANVIRMTKAIKEFFRPFLKNVDSLISYEFDETTKKFYLTMKKLAPSQTIHNPSETKENPKIGWRLKYLVPQMYNKLRFMCETKEFFSRLTFDPYIHVIEKGTYGKAPRWEDTKSKERVKGDLLGWVSQGPIPKSAPVYIWEPPKKSDPKSDKALLTRLGFLIAHELICHEYVMHKTWLPRQKSEGNLKKYSWRHVNRTVGHRPHVLQQGLAYNPPLVEPDQNLNPENADWTGLMLIYMLKYGGVIDHRTTTDYHNYSARERRRFLGDDPSASVARFSTTLARINRLLSYNLIDWKITDAEAIEAFDLLSNLPAELQAAALRQINLDRLRDNLPRAYRVPLEKMLARAGGPKFDLDSKVRQVVERINRLLSYSFTDWKIKDAEANKALNLLKSLKEPDERKRAVLVINYKRLYDNLPNKKDKAWLKALRKSAAGATKLIEPRTVVERINHLLSYSFIDWKITDAEATEAFELLMRLPSIEQQRVVLMINYERLYDNLPNKNQKAQLKAIRDRARSGPTLYGRRSVVERINRLLSYRFTDWEITDAEATEALKLLLSLPEKELLRVVLVINYERLYDNLPEEAQKVHLRYLRDVASTMADRQLETMDEHHTRAKKLLATVKQRADNLTLPKPPKLGKFERFLAKCVLYKYCLTKSVKDRNAALKTLTDPGHGGGSYMGFEMRTGLAADAESMKVKYIDTPYLLGEPKSASVTAEKWNDPWIQGPNFTDIIHFSMGIKYSWVGEAISRFYNIHYEKASREGWHQFGFDSLNDAISVEAGRLFGKDLKGGKFPCKVVKPQRSFEVPEDHPPDLRDFKLDIDNYFKKGREWLRTKLSESKVDEHALKVHLPNLVVDVRPKDKKTSEIKDMPLWSPTLMEQILAGWSDKKILLSVTVRNLVHLYRFIRRG